MFGDNLQINRQIYVLLALINSYKPPKVMTYLLFPLQLYVLQGRMREALEYFYRLRGLQSKADIAEFELKCIKNGDKLVTLQSEMMRLIEHINRFLEANNAAHDVISMEAAKIAKTPTNGTVVAWEHVIIATQYTIIYKRTI